ncbi:beta-N-acetylglucosaminidase [Melghiribacillus thermohalophilus]|uniref:Beta-N-acetylglucosaminidase n=1 Tax=Melghiribacillus thermohalophilus TaxID=1324956 RepID=A0A4R3MWI8_9BACI|nr:SH3 domain-containing protein [Melghiribacillus thermohalophilus]TCT19886.1 beta-N-acetylglucosaminidase [Melghiribacillus thermohalophilus]
MNKIVKTLLVCLLLALFGFTFFVIFTSSASANNSYEGIALKDPTNVYESTSKNSSILKSYSQGSILKYEYYSNKWYKATVYIDHKPYTGYIHKNDVENAVNDIVKFEGIALKNTTHVYSRASINSKPLKSYSKGSILRYESYTNNWYKAKVIVNHKSFTGFIHKDHVENATKDPVEIKGIALNTTNVYREASKNFKILKSYKSGSILKMESYTSGWYKATVYLDYKPYTGYIRHDDIDRLYNSPTELKGISLKTARVFNNPSESSRVLKSYSAGSILQYETYSSKWHKATVYLNGKPRTGYLPVSVVDDLIEQENLRGIAIKGTTHVYESPSTKSKIVKSYSEGSVLIYKSLSKNWHEAVVFVNGKKKKVFLQRSQVENAYKEQKTLRGVALKTPTNAYSGASRKTPVWKTYERSNLLKLKTFSKNWYEAIVIVNGKPRNAYFHHDDVNTGIVYETTQYNIDFNKVVDIQHDVGGYTDGAGLIKATKEQIAYYLNPSNFARGTDSYFQFLVLSQPTGIDAEEVNEKILFNKGTLAGQGEAFVQAGRDYQINELYLIAHAVHETGNGSSVLAQGVEVGRNSDNELELVTDSNREHLRNIKTTYNMYGIHAFDRCPVECGAKKAYVEGWFTPAKAIIGGAKFIREDWIDVGQDTLYKMRWNPENPGKHQYATHIMWAELQTTRIAEYYKLINNYVLFFDIPRYLNQPGPADDFPSNNNLAINIKEYPKNTLAITVVDNLRLRKGPSTNHEWIKYLDKGTILEILDVDNNWIKVQVKGSSDIGWVAKTYNGETYVEHLNLFKITADPLNVRSSPAGKQVGQINYGEYVSAVLDSNNNLVTVKESLGNTEYTWYQIYYGDGTAWIADYVNIVK